MGDEGGFAPNLSRNEEGLELCSRSNQTCRILSRGTDFDSTRCSSAHSLMEKYHLDGMAVSGSELGRLYSTWIDSYPIVSIEDPSSVRMIGILG